MSDYIDREAVIAALAPAYGGVEDYVRKVIGKIPAADVVPVRHGAWRKIKIPPAGYDLHGYLCNLCGYVDEGVHTMTGKPFAYCPNCGARMDA